MLTVKTHANVNGNVYLISKEFADVNAEFYIMLMFCR